MSRYTEKEELETAAARVAELESQVRKRDDALHQIVEMHPPLGDYCNTCGGLFPCHTREYAQVALDAQADTP